MAPLGHVGARPGVRAQPRWVQGVRRAGSRWMQARRSLPPPSHRAGCRGATVLATATATAPAAARRVR